MHFCRCVETTRVFCTLVAIKVSLTPQHIQAMHLVESIDAAKVPVISRAPARSDLDGFGRKLTWHGNELQGMISLLPRLLVNIG